MQPGSVISPGDQSEPKNQDDSEHPTPAPPEPVGSLDSQPEEDSRVADNYQPAEMPEALVGAAITWSASEYISHHKDSSWYMGLGVVTGLAAALVFVVTRDWVTLGSIIIVAVLFGVFASRKPSVLQYTLDESGITIAQKHYPYEEFKSFSVYDEGGLRSIFLLPLKRFMPGLSLYYPPDMEDQVIGAVSQYLPHEERQPDAVDRLMKRVRF